MMKLLLSCLLIPACFVQAWGAKHTSPRDRVQHDVFRDTVLHEVFRDTVVPGSMPPVELDIITYHNFGYTTVGYQITLRNTELQINDVELYAGPSGHKLNTLQPFSLHAGDSTEQNRIDRLRIWNTFPFDTLCPETDSLVLLTDRGNLTLYLGEERRREVALQEQQKAFDLSMNEKDGRYMLWISLLAALLLAATAVAIGLSLRARRRRNEMVNNLFILSSENERINSEMSATLQNLFKQKFETLNKLCFEYFEKGESPALRKSIYNEVEKEILKLRQPAELARLEESLNLYCDGIMARADEQLPALTAAERTLLIYLFSGLSARTICVLCDIEIKAYYMRRYRLRNKILASDAPDKAFFAGNM